MPISFGLTSNLSISQNLSVGGSAAVAAGLTLSDTTASTLLYGNAGKVVSSVTLASNLSLTTGTLALAAALTGINSITSVAGQNLVLALGTGGTALTLANSTRAATFAGNSISMAGGSSWTDSSGTATISGGSSGASLVLGSGTTGVATIAAAAGGLRGLVIGAASSSDGFPLRLLLDSNGAATIDHTNANAGASALARFSLVSSAGTSSLAAYSAAHSVWPGSTLLTAPGAGGLSILATSAGGPIDFYTNSSQAARITSTGNLLIGTTSDMASTAGGLTVAATGSGATATAVNTGGLRSANFGLSTVSGGASYFGGAVTASSNVKLGPGSAVALGAQFVVMDGGSEARLQINSTDRPGIYLTAAGANVATLRGNTTTTEILTSGGTPLAINNATLAATFAGAVTHTLGTNYPPQTAPASPASGWVLYTDSGDGNKLKAKASTGTVVTIGTP